MTAADLIASALRLVGALAHGETPNAEEAANSFDVLNALVDAWNAEGIVYSVTTTPINVPVDKVTYSMGLGSVDGAPNRPLLIRAASTKNAAGVSGPVEVVDATKFSAIQDKSEKAQLVRMLYCDYAYPQATFEVWPVPAAQQTLALRCFYPLAQFAASGDVVQLPAGYLKALRYNLARDLAAEFGFPLDQNVGAIAAETKAALKALSAQTLSGTAPAPAA